MPATRGTAAHPHRDDVFEWVHRKAWPRPDVDVLVVPRVHVGVGGATVKRPVRRRKYAIDHRNEQEGRDEPDRVFVPGDHRGDVVGMAHQPTDSHSVPMSIADTRVKARLSFT